MDWQETLERAIPQPPPTQPDPAALVADGKRLVRRRRLAVVAGSVAAVVAVVGIGAVVDPSRESATPEPPIASHSTDEEWPPPADIPLSDLAPVSYDFETGETTLYKGWTEVDRVGPFTTQNSLSVAVTDGEKTIYAYFENPTEVSYTDASRTTSKSFRDWVAGFSPVAPDITWEPGAAPSVDQTSWEIVREIPNPLGYDAPWGSLGAVIERDGVERWALAEGASTQESSSQSSTIYAIPGQTIEDWLADEKKSRREDFRPERAGFEAYGTVTDVVEFSGSKVVPTRDGVEVLEQLADPDINKSFAAETSQTAAARITVDGKEQYVLVQEKESETRTKNVSWAFTFILLTAPYAEDRAPLPLDEFAAMIRRYNGPKGGPWA